MVSQDKIMTFDYIKEQIKEKYDFANNVNEQPEFFTFNDKQDICIIASEEDGLMININH
jgi:hypothetical protein